MSSTSTPSHVGAYLADGLHRRTVLKAGFYSALLPGVSATAAPATAGAPGNRAALVIGNARYGGAMLKNTVSDARLMQSAAQELGFRVELLLDATYSQMLVAIRAWLASSADAQIRLFYFAGHGAQYRGRNFLIPVDAELRSEDDIPGLCINANDLSDRLSRFEAGVNLVVLDACRSVPLVSPPPGGRTRSTPGTVATAGLVNVAAPRGTLVAFSTAPGALAGDNPNGLNSAYTRHLVAQLRTPGLSIESVFKRTRAAVLHETRGQQVPWEHSSLIGDVCLLLDRSGVCSGR